MSNFLETLADIVLVISYLVGLLWIVLTLILMGHVFAAVTVPYDVRLGWALCLFFLLGSIPGHILDFNKE